jgi:hypothetical protein
MNNKRKMKKKKRTARGIAGVIGKLHPAPGPGGANACVSNYEQQRTAQTKH